MQKTGGVEVEVMTSPRFKLLLQIQGLDSEQRTRQHYLYILSQFGFIMEF